MSAEIIQFVPRPNSKLTEAIAWAGAMNAGHKCAEPNCTVGENGCSGVGCLLNRSQLAQGIDGLWKDGA